jgi:hypothetical protein
MELDLGELNRPWSVELFDADGHAGGDLWRKGGLQSYDHRFTFDLEAEVLGFVRGDTHFEMEALPDREYRRGQEECSPIADVARLGPDERRMVDLGRQFFDPNGNTELPPQGGSSFGRGEVVSHASAIFTASVIPMMLCFSLPPEKRRRSQAACRIA